MINYGFHLPTTEQRCPVCKETWFEDLPRGEKAVCPYCPKQEEAK